MVSGDAQQSGAVVAALRASLDRLGEDIAVAAVAEIGGAWLVWQGVREGRGVLWAIGGVLAFGAYGLVATLQPEPRVGRILAGSLTWGVLVDGFWPDRFDIIGALTCLVGVALIMYAPRAGT